MRPMRHKTSCLGKRVQHMYCRQAKSYLFIHTAYHLTLTRRRSCNLLHTLTEPAKVFYAIAGQHMGHSNKY